MIRKKISTDLLDGKRAKKKREEYDDRPAATTTKHELQADNNQPNTEHSTADSTRRGTRGMGQRDTMNEKTLPGIYLSV